MKKRICSAVLATLTILLVIASPVFAISNPTSITAHTAKAFGNIFETGDMLFVVSYDINTTDNTTNAYLFNLVSADNTTLLFSRQLAYYQYNLSSIYVSAATVVSSNITWGSAYKLRITGNPALFSSLVEGTNMSTKTLSASDWSADGALTSKELLRLHCIDIAESLESDWGVTLLTTTTGGSQALNSTGRTTFLDAIPGLDTAIPSLFQLSTGVPIVTPAVPGAAYAVESKLDSRLGTTLGTAFTGIGSFLGIGQSSAAGLWAIIFIFTIASIAFLNTGNSSAALLLATPVVVLMTYLGAIPEAITYIIAICIAIYAMYFFWLRGT